MEAEETQRKKPGEAGPEGGYAAAFEDGRRDHAPRKLKGVKTQILC